SFGQQQTRPTGHRPVLTEVADINGDGRPDLISMSNHGNTADVLLGRGDGFFIQPAMSGVPSPHTPHLVDLDGDHIGDSVILDGSGTILFRKGLSGSENTFAPPVRLNSKEALHTDQDRPARDQTAIWIGSGWAIAAADIRFDSAL